jgi:hypothetical protein
LAKNMSIDGWTFTRGARRRCCICPTMTVGQYEKKGAVSIPCCPICRDTGKASSLLQDPEQVRVVREEYGDDLEAGTRTWLSRTKYDKDEEDDSVSDTHESDDVLLDDDIPVSTDIMPWGDSRAFRKKKAYHAERVKKEVAKRLEEIRTRLFTR